MSGGAELDEFRLFVDDTGERAHIHQRTEDGDTRCVTQLDAKMAELWAVRLWEAKKKMKGEGE